MLELPNIFTQLKVKDIAHKNPALLKALTTEPESIRLFRKQELKKEKELRQALNDCQKHLGDINICSPITPRVFEPSSKGLNRQTFGKPSTLHRDSMSQESLVSTSADDTATDVRETDEPQDEFFEPSQDDIWSD